jgi:hypothetical protein
MTHEAHSSYELYDQVIAELEQGRLTPEMGRDYSYPVSHVFNSLMFHIRNEDSHGRIPKEGDIVRIKKLMELIPDILEIAVPDEEDRQERLNYIRSRSFFDPKS